MDNIIDLDRLTSYDALIKKYIDSKENGGTITSATATVDNTTSDNPTCDVTVNNNELEFAFSGIKGEKGDTGADGKDGTDGVTPSINVTASVDNSTGIPSVVVTRSGTDEAPNFDFAFSGLKGADGTDGSSSDVTLPATIVTGINADGNLWGIDASEWSDEVSDGYLYMSKQLTLDTYDTSTNTASTKNYSIAVDLPYASSSAAGVMPSTHYNVVDSIINVGSQTGANRMVIPSVLNMANSYEYDSSYRSMVADSKFEGYAFNTETGRFESVSGSSYNVYPQIPVASSSSYGVMSSSDKVKLDNIDSYITKVQDAWAISEWTDEGQITSGANYISGNTMPDITTYNPATQTTTTSSFILAVDIPYATEDAAGVMPSAHYKAVESLIDAGSGTSPYVILLPSGYNSSSTYTYSSDDEALVARNTTLFYAFDTSTGKFTTKTKARLGYDIYPKIPVATTSSGGIMSPDDKTTLDSIKTVLEEMISYMTVDTFTSVATISSLGSSQSTGDTPAFVKVGSSYYIAGYSPSNEYNGMLYNNADVYTVGSFVRVSGTGSDDGLYKITNNEYDGGFMTKYGANITLEKVDDDITSIFKAMWDAITSKALLRSMTTIKTYLGIS